MPNRLIGRSVHHLPPAQLVQWDDHSKGSPHPEAGKCRAAMIVDYAKDGTATLRVWPRDPQNCHYPSQGNEQWANVPHDASGQVSEVYPNSGSWHFAEECPCD